MKILFLTTHLNAGGITSYLTTLCEGLISRRHEVYIVSGGGELASAFAERGARITGLNIKTKSELSLKIYRALPTIHRIINENKIDIVHSQTRVTQVMGQCLRSFYGHHFVSTCHGFFKVRWSRKAFPCWGEAVIAISSAVKDHLQNEFKVPRERVHLIPNGINIDRFKPVQESDKIDKRRALGLFNEPVIGHIARLSDVKGTDLLINALPAVLKEVPSAKLIIVGEGKWEEKLLALVRSLSIEDHVLFFPTSNRTQEFLALFDIFVMPSRQEGLGLSILEAQAAGVPVIATKVGGIPHIIDHAKTGWLIEPESPPQISAAIIALLNNKGKGREMAAAARKVVVEHYTADQMVDKTLKLYGQVIGDGHQ